MIKKSLMALALVGAAASAQAATVFVCNSNNSGQCPTVAGQTSMTITDLGAGQVSFKFENSGSLVSSLTDFYWNSSQLSSTGAITGSGAGVDISWDAAPPNPGGGIDWNATYSADSNSPASQNGVGLGEWVTFVFGFTGSYADLVSGLKVGLHAQSIGGGQSDWMSCAAGKCGGRTEVPVPGTLGLLGLGFAGLGLVRRKQKA